MNGLVGMMFNLLQMQMVTNTVVPMMTNIASQNTPQQKVCVGVATINGKTYKVFSDGSQEEM